MKYALTAAIVFGFAGIAFAADGSQFVIIKDKNQHCRVVEQNLVSEDELGIAGRQAGLSEHGRGQHRPEGRLRQLVSRFSQAPLWLKRRFAFRRDADRATARSASFCLASPPRDEPSVAPKLIVLGRR